MIPYLVQPAIKLGPFTVYGAGIAVAAAVITGYLLILRGAGSAGLTAASAGRIYCAVVASGLMAGYWWNARSGISGTGLAIGGALCLLLCATAVRFWPTLDLFASAIPATLAIARIGCFMAHDHIGRPTDSWLGVQFPGGTRYDLGLLYALAAGAAGVALFSLARFSLARFSLPSGVVAGSTLVLIAAGRAAVLPLDRAPRDVDFWFAVSMIVTGMAVVGFRVRAPHKAC